MIDYNPAAQLARGLHSALSNDPILSMTLGDPPRLYDFAPDDPVFPYLTYGTLRSHDVSGDGAPLTAHTVTLHVWSRYSGRSEVLSLINTVRHIIEKADISSPKMRVINANVTYTDVFRTADGRTLHGLVTASFKTQPIDIALEEVA